MDEQHLDRLYTMARDSMRHIEEHAAQIALHTKDIAQHEAACTERWRALEKRWETSDIIMARLDNGIDANRQLWIRVGAAIIGLLAVTNISLIAYLWHFRP